MSQLGKWIDGLGPESSVSEAARLSLEARLSAVMYWLPLAAAYSHRDIEYVHRLRVSTRRATAALKLYRDWLPNRPTRWLKKRLRRIRRAAGLARDLDVLAERMRQYLGQRGDELLAEVAERRAAAQPAIIAMRDWACCRDRLRQKTDKLVRGIASPRRTKQAERKPCFRDWAARQLRNEADEFFAAAPNDDSDRAALHQFRIRGKALRYGIELLASAFGPELREQHYPMIEELQERLGRLNDYASGVEQLREWRESADNRKRRALLEECIEREEAQLAQELGKFRQWWTPERVDALRQGLLGHDQKNQPAAVEEQLSGQT